MLMTSESSIANSAPHHGTKQPVPTRPMSVTAMSTRKFCHALVRIARRRIGPAASRLTAADPAATKPKAGSGISICR